MTITVTVSFTFYSLVINAWFLSIVTQIVSFYTYRFKNKNHLSGILGGYLQIFFYKTIID